MRRLLLATAVLSLLVISSPARAERFEIGMNFDPTFHWDQTVEAFNDELLASARFGPDLRFEVARPGGYRIIPLLGYRYSATEGYLLSLKNEMQTHDFEVGLRVRKGLLTWLGVYAELRGGILWTRLDSTFDWYEGAYGIDSRRADYKDSQVTWSLGGSVGMTVKISKTWLRSRGVKHFGFAGDIGVGVTGRGDTELDPTLEEGDDYDLPTDSAGPWGTANLSGWHLHMGLTLHFD